MTSLDRLFRPRSIAVLGGGAWCRSVLEQCRKFGFEGDLWPVHRSEAKLAGIPAHAALSDLPNAPDATFIGVNREAAVEAVRALSTMGGGGAVCFASGFREAEAELPGGTGLEAQLVAAAGNMPVLGPNCYGYINALDGALLWPDQHGLARTSAGVAIVTQSSNMAINITMQARALPIGFVATAGNQARTGMAEVGTALIEDDRITVLGLHVEGFRDLRAFEALSQCAADRGKEVVVLKVGRSSQARAAAVSHTASLAGGDAGAAALIDRLGFARAESLPGFLETLKLLHVTGALPSNRIASVSCSGGEAILAADAGCRHGVSFPRLNRRQERDLREVLGPRVALANPLDYHTYIWRDADAMTRAWSAITDPELALTMLIVDFPRGDRCNAADWECAVSAALATRMRTGANVAMVATLPELMPEPVAARLLAGGVVPLAGLVEAVQAIAAAALLRRRDSRRHLPLLLPGRVSRPELRREAEAKAALAEFGLAVPRSLFAATPAEAARSAREIGFPVVLKSEGHAHKTEAGAVALGLASEDAVQNAASTMGGEEFLVEEMIGGAVAELLIGVVRDPAHGYVLTIGAGGVLTDLLDDRRSLLVPAHPDDVADALDGLRLGRLIAGWRGSGGANRGAVIRSVMSVQDYVLANCGGLQEVEVNPLICRADGAVAVDALLRRDR